MERRGSKTNIEEKYYLFLLKKRPAEGLDVHVCVQLVNRTIIFTAFFFFKIIHQNDIQKNAVLLYFNSAN